MGERRRNGLARGRRIILFPFNNRTSFDLMLVFMSRGMLDQDIDGV